MMARSSELTIDSTPACSHQWTCRTEDFEWLSCNSPQLIYKRRAVCVSGRLTGYDHELLVHGGLILMSKVQCPKSKVPLVSRSFQVLNAPRLYKYAGVTRHWTLGLWHCTDSSFLIAVQQSTVFVLASPRSTLTRRALFRGITFVSARPLNSGGLHTRLRAATPPD